MSDFEDSSARLETALQDIESSISGTETVSSTFRAEVEEMTRSMAIASKQASGLSRSVGTSLKSAFDSLIVDGDKLSNVIGKLGSSIASKAFSSALTPVTDALGQAVRNWIDGGSGTRSDHAAGAGCRWQAWCTFRRWRLHGACDHEREHTGC